MSEKLINFHLKTVEGDFLKMKILRVAKERRRVFEYIKEDDELDNLESSAFLVLFLYDENLFKSNLVSSACETHEKANSSRLNAP